MLWSKLFIPTLREEPAQAQSPAHALLIRAGYLRRLPAGGHAYLFTARRSLHKIVQIVREQMDSAGAQEIFVPQPRDLLALAEEIRSPKQLPQLWYSLEASKMHACCFDSGQQGD